jgi:hypothetical protein
MLRQILRHRASPLPFPSFLPLTLTLPKLAVILRAIYQKFSERGGREGLGRREEGKLKSPFSSILHSVVRILDSSTKVSRVAHPPLSPLIPPFLWTFLVRYLRKRTVISTEALRWLWGKELSWIFCRQMALPDWLWGMAWLFCGLFILFRCDTGVPLW